MKSYVFTEMELKQRIDKLQGTYHNTLDLVVADSLVDEMVEGKQEIKLLATGDFKSMRVDEGILFRLNGNMVKIYIEELPTPAGNDEDDGDY